MERSLDVYLHNTLGGRLIQDDYGQLGFTCDQGWLESPTSVPLSQSLKLRDEPFGRNECRGFFGGLLPEETQREIITKNLGISKKNDFALLEKIGGECAGAVTFLPSGTSPQDTPDGYPDITAQDLEKDLKELPKRPLLAGEEGVRLSLAGAQNKLAVRVTKSGISIPLGGAPSTHIIKPTSRHFPGLIENEAFCLNLANAVGLNAARAKVEIAGETSYLLVERYDRIQLLNRKGANSLRRLHQEDFCQALGVPSELKYQNEGGPSLKQCFDLLRSASSQPARDAIDLFDAVIFNYLVGNHDAHGKNFSLLYIEAADGQLQTRLAPLYDLICTEAYPDLSKKMAMKIGSEYDSSKIRLSNFDKLADDIGFTKKLTEKRIADLALRILKALPNVDGQFDDRGRVLQLITKNCEKNLRD